MYFLNPYLFQSHVPRYLSIFPVNVGHLSDMLCEIQSAQIILIKMLLCEKVMCKAIRNLIA